MLAVSATWRRAGTLVWHRLPRVLLLGALWVLSSWPVVTAGPATLAAYRWAALNVRDERDESPLTFFRYLLDLLLPGLAWFMVAGLVALLFIANLRYWPQVLAPLPAAVVLAAWSYALVFLLAMQPHLLERVAVQRRRWPEALPASALAVALNPLYAHAQLLLPAAALYVGSRFHLALPLALASATLVFLAVSAADLPLWPEDAARLRKDGSRE